MTKVIDPSSLSNLDEIVTKHLHFNWTINFAEKKIGGNVVLDVTTLVSNVSKIVLDTSYLDIKGVSINGQSLEVSCNKKIRVLTVKLNTYYSTLLLNVTLVSVLL
jgi:aminopeptidase N